MTSGPPRQVEVEVLPDGPENPYGNAFRVKETELLTESGELIIKSAARGTSVETGPVMYGRAVHDL